MLTTTSDASFVLGALKKSSQLGAYTALITFNNKAKDYPFAGVVPSGPATGSWPCRNQSTCNFFDKNNPIIPEHIRRIDLLVNSYKVKTCR